MFELQVRESLSFVLFGWQRIVFVWFASNYVHRRRCVASVLQRTLNALGSSVLCDALSFPYDDRHIWVVEKGLANGFFHGALPR